MARRAASRLKRNLRHAGIGLLAVVLLAYPLDWTAWRLRMLFGRGMDSVQLTETTAATLKGDRFEIEQQQTLTANCSRSFLPEAGAGPCWWLRRHAAVVTQY